MALNRRDTPEKISPHRAHGLSPDAMLVGAKASLSKREPAIKETLSPDKTIGVKSNEGEGNVTHIILKKDGSYE